MWLIWKEPNSHRRYKIGDLIKSNNKYRFNYINPELEDAKTVGFKYFSGFEDTTKIYESDNLFMNIATRLPNSNRPDYLEMLNYYNLEKDSYDLTILKATRGRTFTDNYEFVPAFDKSKIELIFPEQDIVQI